MRGISFVGTMHEFRAIVLPEIRRCAMRGLRIGKGLDALCIQARINRATAERRKAA